MLRIFLFLALSAALPAFGQDFVVNFRSSRISIGEDDFRKSDSLKVRVGGVGLARMQKWGGFWSGEVRFDQQGSIENIKTVDISLIRLSEGTASQIGINATGVQSNVVDLSAEVKVDGGGNKRIGIAVIAIENPDKLFDFIVADYSKAVNAPSIQRKMRYEDSGFRFVTEVIKAVTWNEEFESAVGGKLKGQVASSDNLSVSGNGSRKISGTVDLSAGTTIGYNFSMLCWAGNVPIGYAIDRIDLGRDIDNCPPLERRTY